MAITILDVVDRQIELTKYLHGSEVSAELYTLLENRPALALLLVGAILGNRVELEVNGVQPNSSGLAVESSVQDVAASANFLWLNKSTLEQILPKIAEIPCQVEHQLKTTIHRFPKIKPDCDPNIVKTLMNWGLLAWGEPYIAFASGQVSELLNDSRWILFKSWIEPLSDARRVQIMSRYNQLNRDCYAFGVAFRPLAELPSTNRHPGNHTKFDLIFIGTMAITANQNR